MLLQIVAFFHEVLSAVGILEQDCCYIFCNFGAMSLVAKNVWEASVEDNIAKVNFLDVTLNLKAGKHYLHNKE